MSEFIYVWLAKCTKKHDIEARKETFFVENPGFGLIATTKSHPQVMLAKQA